MTTARRLSTGRRRRAVQATPTITSSGSTCRRGYWWSASPVTCSRWSSCPDVGCAAHQRASTCQQSPSQTALLWCCASRPSSLRPPDSSSSKTSAGCNYTLPHTALFCVHTYVYALLNICFWRKAACLHQILQIDANNLETPTNYYYIRSRPSDHYFRSVCWFVCLCRVFLSRLWSDFDQSWTFVISLCLVVSRRI